MALHKLCLSIVGLSLLLVCSCSSDTKTNTGTNSTANTSDVTDGDTTPEKDIDKFIPGNCGSLEEHFAFLLHNSEREKSNKPALACDMKLVEAARAHSEAMCKGSFLAHNQPGGPTQKDRFKAAGIDPSFEAAENLARGPSTAQSLLTEWIKDLGNRSIVLGGYDKIGVGFVKCDTTTYWTAIYVKTK